MKNKQLSRTILAVIVFNGGFKFSKKVDKDHVRVLN